MPVDVSQEEYFAALTHLLATADPFAADDTHSNRDCAMTSLLNWAYECSGPVDEFRPSDILPILDRPSAEIALTVIAGRCFYGRPGGHPLYKEFLAFCDMYRDFRSLRRQALVQSGERTRH